MTTAKKPRSPEFAAAFATHYEANQALAFAEMDRDASERAYFNNANRYSHGQRKSQALRRGLEAAEAKVEAARIVADAAREAYRVAKENEAKTAQ